MSLTANALADLRFGLRFAAERFGSYADYADFSYSSELFRALASERNRDARDLDRIAEQTGLEDGMPTLDIDNVGRALGMGRGDPNSATSAAFRVQRAENTLGLMTAQLRSLTSLGELRTALGRVRDHIDKRRADVRIARRHAKALEKQTDFASQGELRENRVAMHLAKDEVGRQVTVWFATNRQRDDRGRFSGERSKEVTYGQCQVYVPKNREVGSLGRGLIGRMLHGDNRVHIQSTEGLSQLAFWDEISSEISRLDDRERQAIVFLHGYKTKFDDAARRTAQLKFDLSHTGPAAFFSWPSLGHIAGYSGDEAAIEGSEEDIREFLIDFAQRSGAKEVHIIAHSMGNRGLLRAMDTISRAAALATPIRFGQIFLAAPDVDAQLFDRLAVAYGALATRTTLYVTRNDKAIGLSKKMHQFARVGLVPPVSVVPGIDTIDASNVNLGLLGHSYAAEVRPVLADIHELINDDTPPDRRFGLRRATEATAAHWEFVR